MKRNKKIQFKFKIIDESFMKRTLDQALSHDSNWVKPKKDEKIVKKKSPIIIEPKLKKVERDE